MNDDALAAVIAAARLYVERRAPGPAAVAPPSRWAIAGRLRASAAFEAPAIARARSRWALLGRLP